MYAISHRKEDMEDPLVLQEFIGDCLVDYDNCIDIAAADLIMEEVDDFHHSLSSVSDCNSSTVISTTSSPSKRPELQHNNNNTQKPCPGQPGDKSCNSTLSLKARPKRQAEQCHNHIIAERQRRQTLSQRFIALSALIPGLKKMDKTSVIGEAISHMKELKERVKMLEEENAKRAVESVVVVRRSQVVVETDEIEISSIINNPNNSVGSEKKQNLPEIEARFSNNNILMKIHCDMKKGLLVKLMTEIEKLNLTVTSIYAVPFNANALDITLMLQREVECDRTPEKFLKDLRSIFQRL